MKLWYKIRNQAGQNTEVLLYEEIGENFFGEGTGAKQFAADIKGMGDLDVRINSPGGNVFEGLAIHNILKAHAGKVHVYIDGVAASIASVIAMAGDTITMPANAMMMIHDPFGFASGTAEDMASMSDALGKIKAALVTTYEARTKISADAIGALMSATTWMTAAEALKDGFTDEVTGAVEASNFNAHQWGNIFANAPGAITIAASVAAPQKGTQVMKYDDKDITLALVTNSFPELAKALRDEGAAAAGASSTEVQDAVQAAVSAEQARVKAVRAAVDGFGLPDEQVEAMLSDSTVGEAQAALAVIKFEREARATNLNNQLADAGNHAKPNSSAAGAGAASGTSSASLDANLPVEDRAKQMWAKNMVYAETGTRVRDEFLDEAGLAAYMEAFDNGQVKMLHGRETA